MIFNQNFKWGGVISYKSIDYDVFKFLYISIPDYLMFR